jgi:ectoine hydroxylase-related dioxygenase (phytanoyl-CoA dioxygenase family)
MVLGIEMTANNQIAIRRPGGSPPSQFAEQGVAIFEYVLTADDLRGMDAAFPELAPRTAGARLAAFSPDVQAWLAAHDGLQELASRLLQAPGRLSRIQAFDKSPSANWFVPWHQDRAEDGHERSVAQLEGTVALRVHLDDCDENNGPLEVIPGSHTAGRLDADAIAAQTAVAPSMLCLTVRGDILAMRPLLIHRSQRARAPAARRVLHLEYAAS